MNLRSSPYFLLFSICWVAMLSAQGDTPPDSSDEFVFSGKVVDEDGKPVSAARVFLFHPYRENDPSFETTTKADGTYTLSTSDLQEQATVLVRKPGYCVSAITHKTKGSPWHPGDYQSALRKSKSMVIESEHILKPAKLMIVTVLDQDGKPIPVGACRFGYISVAAQSLRNDLLNDLPINVDKNQITVDCFAIGSYFELKFGRDQSIGSTEFFDVEARVSVNEDGKVLATIPQAGTVFGRITSFDGNPVDGATVTVSTSPAENVKQVDRTNCALTVVVKVETDSEGRYKAENIPSGSISVSAKSQEHYSVNQNQPAILKPNETTEIDVTVRPVCRVTGRVIDSNGDPIPNLELNVGIPRKKVMTNINGEYAGTVANELGIVNLEKIPDGFIKPYLFQTSFSVEPGQKEHRVDDIVLEKVDALTGAVLDDNGQPVPHAVVRSFWIKTKDGSSTAAFDQTVADENGRFELKRTTQKYDVTISARSEKLGSADFMTISPQDGRQPLELKISSDGVVMLKGSVVDSNGSPLPNATISLKQGLFVQGYVYGEYKIFQGEECKTDSAGNYEFPVGLSKLGKYSVSVQKKGYLTAETPLLTAKENDAAFRSHSPIKLTKTRSANGVVLGSGGEPIAGATITSYAAVKRGDNQKSLINVQTTDSGSFDLENLHPDCHLCFVSKPGYRFRGAAIDFDTQDDSGFKITLERSDESTQQPPLRLISIDEPTRKRLVLKLIDEQFKLRKKLYSGYWLSSMFNFALDCDQVRAEQIVSDAALNSAKAVMLFQLGAIDEAVELSQALTTPGSRARALRTGADHVDDVERKRQLLLEAAFQTKAIQDVGTRIESYASIIESLFDCGDQDSARELAEVAIPLATTLGNDGRGPFARGWLARGTVELLPTESVELIASITDANSSSRHYGNLAHEMAHRDPEFAEKLLGKIESPAFHIPRVAYRMGPVDLPRAERLVVEMENRTSSQAHQANGMGALAYSLRESDPEKAKELLSVAFTMLFNKHDHRYSLGVAINLLRYASEIAPEQSDAYFWQTLALYADPNHASWGADDFKSETQIHMAKQAVLLALFDRLPEVRVKILAPIMNDLSDLSDKNERWFQHANDRGTLVAAMALSLPEQTLEWQRIYYTELPKEAPRYLPQPWEVIGNCWTKSNAELANYIVSELEHDWVIDKEDY